MAIGTLPEIIIETYGLDCASPEVKLFPGAIKHMMKRHPGIYETYGNFLQTIIEEPDFVGQNPKEPNSVELIKRLGEDLLIAVKLDPSGYLFLSTMYELNNGEYKIANRLRSGRLKTFDSLLETSEKM